MTEKEQKDLLKEHEDLKDKVKSLEKDIKKKTFWVDLLVGFSGYVLLALISIHLSDNKQNKTDEDLYSKNEELRKIICDIHKDTNTSAPKYDFKANKFVTGGYKYDRNLVKKLQELCKSNTH